MDFRTIHDINYVTLDYIEADAQRILNDPNSAYRHKKDKDTLRRIAVLKQAKKRKAKRHREEQSWIGLSGLSL
jgi:hypothetical protein